MPKVSVIVPVYKVEPYLRRCVDSILAQTFTDFELILVDDGSPDNCPAVCDEYAAKDSRVHVIHQENGGLSAARNAGIDWAFANSDSEWISFVDSDDWVHPEMLERLLHAVQECGVSVGVCGFARTEGEESEIRREELFPQKWSTEVFFVEHDINAIVAWGKLYRKVCFDGIRYPVGKIHEDEFITYRVLFQEGELAVIFAPLYNYYQNKNGIMGQGWSMRSFSRVIAFRERIVFFHRRKYYKAYTYAVSAYMGQLYRVLILIQTGRSPRFRDQWKVWWRFCLANIALRHDFDEYAVENAKRTKLLIYDWVIHTPNRIGYSILGERRYNEIKNMLRR